MLWEHGVEGSNPFSPTILSGPGPSQARFHAAMNRDHTRLMCDVGELSGLFSDATSLQAFLQKTVEMVVDRMQSDVCSIYLYHEDSGELVLTATQGLDPRAVGQVRLRLGEGLTGLAVEARRPICERHASQRPEYKYFPQIGEEP